MCKIIFSVKEGGVPVLGWVLSKVVVWIYVKDYWNILKVNCVKGAPEFPWAFELPLEVISKMFEIALLMITSDGLEALRVSIGRKLNSNYCFFFKDLLNIKNASH